MTFEEIIKAYKDNYPKYLNIPPQRETWAFKEAFEYNKLLLNFLYITIHAFDKSQYINLSVVITDAMLAVNPEDHKFISDVWDILYLTHLRSKNWSHLNHL